MVWLGGLWFVACSAAPSPASREVLSPPAISSSVAVPDELPVHSWNFNHPAGLEILDEQGGVHGRIGEAAVQVYGQGCREGALQLLGGQKSSVDFGERLERLGREDFTVMFWFSTKDHGGAREMFSNRADASHGNFFNIRMSARGEVVAELDENNIGLNYVNVKSRAELEDGHWHHVAVRRRGTQVTLFLDAEQVAEGASDEVTDLSGESSFRLGSSDVAEVYNGFFVGFMDDVKIFHTPVGAEKIRSIYELHRGELAPCKWHPVRSMAGSRVTPPTLVR